MPKAPKYRTTYRESKAGLRRAGENLVSAISGRKCLDASCMQPRDNARAQIAAAVPELLRGRVAPTPCMVLPRYARDVVELDSGKKIGQLAQRDVFQVPPKSTLHAGVESVEGKVLVAFAYRDNGADVVKMAFVIDQAVFER